MIEELDRTALTHGKLLFPFKLSAANKPCGCSGESRKREETTLPPKEHTRPISTRVRSLPAKRSYCRGARLRSARAIYLCALSEIDVLNEDRDQAAGRC